LIKTNVSVSQKISLAYKIKEVVEQLELFLPQRSQHHQAFLFNCDSNNAETKIWRVSWKQNELFQFHFPTSCSSKSFLTERQRGLWLEAPATTHAQLLMQPRETENRFFTVTLDSQIYQKWNLNLFHVHQMRLFYSLMAFF